MCSLEASVSLLRLRRSLLSPSSPSSVAWHTSLSPLQRETGRGHAMVSSSREQSSAALLVTRGSATLATSEAVSAAASRASRPVALDDRRARAAARAAATPASEGDSSGYLSTVRHGRNCSLSCGTCAARAWLDWDWKCAAPARCSSLAILAKRDPGDAATGLPRMSGDV